MRMLGSGVVILTCSLSAACAEGRFNESETRQVRSFAARVDALAGEMGHLKELMKKQEEAIKLKDEELQQRDRAIKQRDKSIHQLTQIVKQMKENHQQELTAVCPVPECPVTEADYLKALSARVDAEVGRSRAREKSNAELDEKLKTGERVERAPRRSSRHQESSIEYDQI